MRVGGIGKFPFISASQEKLSFGRLLNGQSATQHIKLRNNSLVYARFVIVRSVADVSGAAWRRPASHILADFGLLHVGGARIHFLS